MTEPAPDETAQAHETARTEQWRQVLMGEDPGLPNLRRNWRRLPSSPRCKLCAAPFRGPGSLLTRLIMHGPSLASPLMCNLCFGQLRDDPGGAEIVIAGEAHAARAIAAGRAVLAKSEAGDLAASGARVGVGVHTGVAFVGAVGSGDKLDFSALGDTVNVAARLGSVAGPGELVVSETAWTAAGATDPVATDAAAEHRMIDVAGRSAPLGVVVLRSPVGVPA